MSSPFNENSPDPPLRLLAAFHEAFPAKSLEWFLQAPEREMWIAASLSTDDVVTVAAPDLQSRAAFTWRTAKTKRTVIGRPLPHWSRYVAGLVLMLTENGMNIPGVDAVIFGEELAGLRYDLALGMAFAAFVYQLHARPYKADELRELVDRVRREYVDA